MVIVAVDDYEFWIGESVEACVAAAAKCHGNPVTHEQYADAHEIDGELLDRLKFIDTDENENQIGEPRTFRDQIAIEIQNGGEFLRMFACNDC